MVYRAIIHTLLFVLSTSIYFSYGVKLLKIKNDLSPCEKFLGIPGWTIDNLRNVTLDKWPWNCLPQDNILNDIVEKSCPHIVAAAKAGYIGFTQFYLHKERGKLGDEMKEYTLLAAAESGNLRLVKYLIDWEGIRMDTNDAQLLHHAARGGNVEMLAYLVFERKLNKSGTSDMQQTALHCAAAAGQLKVVYFLVEVLNLNVNARTENLFTPAHYAAMTSLQMLQYLIDDREANFDAETRTGETLLHFAAIQDKPATVEYLVEQKNMSVYRRTLRGETPLIYAIHGGSLANVKYFVEEKHVDIKGTDKLGRSILHDAARGSAAVMKYFVEDHKMLDRINDVDNVGNTPALEAVKFKSLDVLRYLLDEKHANPYIVNKEGHGLLRMAVIESWLPIVRYLIDEKGFKMDEETHEYVILFSCLTDLQLCRWLEQYQREKGSVRSFKRR